MSLTEPMWVVKQEVYFVPKSEQAHGLPFDASTTVGCSAELWGRPVHFRSNAHGPAQSPESQSWENDQASYAIIGQPECESGGIGRRTRLRIWRVKPWGFESPLSHQLSTPFPITPPLRPFRLLCLTKRA